MSWKIFCSKVDPICLKNDFGIDEYTRVKNTCAMVNSTALYNVYKTMTADPVPYREFYTLLRSSFYYDRYVCSHGTEFMYYVKLKDLDISTKEPTDVIEVVRAVQ